MENKEKQPKISVLMPLYNTPEEYLRPAIESILAQTFMDFEFLILNDSPDNKSLEKIVHSYNDSRIRYYVNERNSGISRSRNRLMDLARGEYYAVMDHDDISLPERLAKQSVFLDSHPEIGVVSSWYERCSQRNRIVKSVNSSSPLIEEELFNTNRIMHPATMIRASVIKDNKLYYEEQFTPAEDYALFGRMIGKTKFAVLPEVLFKYRIFGGNTSRVQKELMRRSMLDVQAFIRKDHPELWHRIQGFYPQVTTCWLFGIIPFLTIRQFKKRTWYKLFGFLPLLVTRSERKIEQR